MEACQGLVLNHQNSCRIANCLGPVSDDDTGNSERGDGLIDYRFGGWIEVRGTFIEKQ